MKYLKELVDFQITVKNLVYQIRIVSMIFTWPMIAGINCITIQFLRCLIIDFHNITHCLTVTVLIAGIYLLVHEKQLLQCLIR